MDTLTGKWVHTHCIHQSVCQKRSKVLFTEMLPLTVRVNEASNVETSVLSLSYFWLGDNKENTQEWIPCFNLFYLPTFFQYTTIWFYYLRAACINLFWFKISENLRTETVNHVSVSDAAKLSLNVLIWLAVSSMPSLRKENLPAHPFTAGKNPECLFKSIDTADGTFVT